MSVSAHFLRFPLFTLHLLTDCPGPGWGVLKQRSASELARSAGKRGDWNHMRWSKLWNQLAAWANSSKPVLTHIWSGWRGSSMVNRKKGKWANTYAAAVNLLLCWSQVPVHKLYRNTVNTSVPSERKSDEGDITNTLWFQFCTPVCSHVNTPFPWRFCRRKQTCRLYYLHLWKPGLWCRVLGMWWMCFQEIVNKLKRCVIPESCVSVTCFLSVWEVCVIMSVILTAVSSCTHMPSQLLLFVCFGCNSETKVLCHTSVWNDI